MKDLIFVPKVSVNEKSDPFFSQRNRFKSSNSSVKGSFRSTAFDLVQENYICGIVFQHAISEGFQQPSDFFALGKVRLTGDFVRIFFRLIFVRSGIHGNPPKGCARKPEPDFGASQADSILPFEFLSVFPGF